MKTKEELNALKEEVEAMNKKLAELNPEELEQVVGGSCDSRNKNIFWTYAQTNNSRDESKPYIEY